MVQNQISVLKQETRSKKGFTLVELVIVIAVLAIIAAIAIPTVQNVVRNANKSSDETNRQAVELALKTAYAEIQSGTDNGKYVTPSSGSTVSPSDVKVSDVLSANSINGGQLPTLKYYGLNGVAGGWKYTSDGAVVVDDSVTGATALANDTTLATIFG